MSVLLAWYRQTGKPFWLINFYNAESRRWSPRGRPYLPLQSSKVTEWSVFWLWSLTGRRLLSEPGFEPTDSFSTPSPVLYLTLLDHVLTCIRKANSTDLPLVYDNSFTFPAVGWPCSRTALSEPALSCALLVDQWLEGSIQPFWSAKFLKTFDLLHHVIMIP